MTSDFDTILAQVREDNRKTGRMQFKVYAVKELQRMGISSVIVAMILALDTEEDHSQC